jgi:hypothetical protein
MAKQQLEVTLNCYNMVVFTHIAFSIKKGEDHYHFDTMPGERGTPSSSYTFLLEADFQEILHWWAKNHWKHHISQNNCGDITQAFLEKFAEVPPPRPFAAPYTINHLSLGICLPSFLPIGITLPGRILDNAQFHLYVREHPELLKQYNPKTLKLLIGMSITLMLASAIGIATAAIFLSGTVMTTTIVASSVLGSAATLGLFKSLNRLAITAENKLEKPQIDQPGIQLTQFS